MVDLTEYEAKQVRAIEVWKSERPSLLLDSYRKLVGRFSKLVARLVPDKAVEAALKRVEAMAEVHDFAADIREAAGVSTVSELLHRDLEACDRLARMVGIQAEHRALLEGAVPSAIGIVLPQGGGAAAAVADIPVLLEASLRAIRRVGHCYGFELETAADRRFVLAILNLANADEPAGSEEIRCGLWRTGGPPDRKLDGSDTADTIKESLADDLPIEAMPVLGDVANLVLDYAFVRRVDETARRVFQERWLRANNRVDSITSAPGFRRRSSVEGITAVASEIAYLGAYGVSFGVTFPTTLAALAIESVAPEPMLRGVHDGAWAARRDSAHWLESLGRTTIEGREGSAAPALTV